MVQTAHWHWVPSSSDTIMLLVLLIIDLKSGHVDFHISLNISFSTGSPNTKKGKKNVEKQNMQNNWVKQCYSALFRPECTLNIEHTTNWHWVPSSNDTKRPPVLLIIDLKSGHTNMLYFNQHSQNIFQFMECFTFHHHSVFSHCFNHLCMSQNLNTFTKKNVQSLSSFALIRISLNVLQPYLEDKEKTRTTSKSILQTVVPKSTKLWQKISHCIVRLDSCHHMSLSKSDGTCWHVAIRGG